jgi:hypothetical protein
LKAEDHTQWVGAIVTNLAALETVLRRFLVEARRQNAPFPRPGDQDAKKSYLTSYLSLDEIIKKYRNTLRDDEAKFRVDTKVVGIRDAFAHGRMVTESGLPFHLWKFGRASRGRVPVEFSKELTVEWLKETALMIEREKDKVLECFKRRDYKGLN